MQRLKEAGGKPKIVSKDGEKKRGGCAVLPVAVAENTDPRRRRRRSPPDSAAPRMVLRTAPGTCVCQQGQDGYSACTGWAVAVQMCLCHREHTGLLACTCVCVCVCVHSGLFL